MAEGIVNLLKPPGMTSSDAVADIRKIFGMKRVGHTGTLDPGAAGVLPICLGRATRLFDYIIDRQKEYIAEVRFGIATDTQDSYGRVTARTDGAVTLDMLNAALPRFTGEIEQIAPMYSAVHSGGKKLYQLAREGAETVECRRRVNIYALETLRDMGNNSFLIRIVCSKGTYVRTLCADIGESLGVCSHMAFLLRARTGEFTLDNAYTMDELRAMKERGELERAVMPIERALCALGEARLELDERAARLLVNGASVEHPSLDGYEVETPLRTYCNGEFIGIGLALRGAMHIRLNLTGEGEGR